jgi:hypothetical protein
MAVLHPFLASVHHRLHRASYNGDVKFAQVLLERGASINARNEWGNTPLHKVLFGLSDGAGASYFDTIQLLLENGAFQSTFEQIFRP